MFTKTVLNRLHPRLPILPSSISAHITAALKQSSNRSGSVRHLNLHEYQSIALLRKYGATVQQGNVASTPNEAKQIAENILSSDPTAELIVKAQIHAGGRGKGTFTNGFKGGVKIVNTSDEVATNTQNMLGNYLVTKQTSEAGQLCQKVLINKGITINDEKYFALLLDRSHNGPVMVGSRKGGMNIEEVAEETPEEIVTIPIDITRGMSRDQAEDMARKIAFTGPAVAEAATNMLSLYKLFIAHDATQVPSSPFSLSLTHTHTLSLCLSFSQQVEINPMATATDGHVYCVDAKLNFDDNASFRQKDIFALRDTSMEDERDVKAEAVGLNYIALDGSIGCMVNGAGLAMATMDIIQLYGGKPANFLDVGGGATKEQVAEAFKILVSDPK
jgi:succinyl-CoA synthetase beta subunit